MLTEEIAKKQLETLHQEGSALAKALAEVEENDSFEVGYQSWYSRALPLMKQLGLDRYPEFQRYYQGDPRSWWADEGSYTVRDYLLGRESAVGSFDERKETVRCFKSQLAILKSVADRLTWTSLDTEDQAERGLQLAFLEAARGLIEVNERAAGVLAGSVLESYLKKLAFKHKLKFRKNAPPPCEFVESLKTAKVFDVAVGSQATWLAELSDRARSDAEGPTKLQVRDLVDGARWLITNIF